MAKNPKKRYYKFGNILLSENGKSFRLQESIADKYVSSGDFSKLESELTAIQQTDDPSGIERVLFGVKTYVGDTISNAVKAVQNETSRVENLKAMQGAEVSPESEREMNINKFKAKGYMPGRLPDDANSGDTTQVVNGLPGLPDDANYGDTTQVYNPGIFTRLLNGAINQIGRLFNRISQMFGGEGSYDVHQGFGNNPATWAFGITCALAILVIYKIVKWFKNKNNDSEVAESVVISFSKAVKESTASFKSITHQLREGETSTQVLDDVVTSGKLGDVINGAKNAAEASESDDESMFGKIKTWFIKNWGKVILTICAGAIMAYGYKKLSYKQSTGMSSVETEHGTPETDKKFPTETDPKKIVATDYTKSKTNAEIFGAPKHEFDTDISAKDVFGNNKSTNLN